MIRAITLGSMLVLVSALLIPVDLAAQSKDDTVVYAIQSDMQNWTRPTRCSARASSWATTSSITSPRAI